MSFTFASWNINSIRVRAPHVMDWLNRHPDCQLLALQEIKCEDHAFPSIFTDSGLHVALVGQKTYNGVAFISRTPISITTHYLPGFNNPSARYIECKINNTIIGNLYLPNGNSGGEKGFKTKLEFCDALFHHAHTLHTSGKPFALIGDYNICPTDSDFSSGSLSEEDALIRHESRSAFRRLIWSGLTDALKSYHPNATPYTFWDYQGGAFQRNKGVRIDHALLSPSLMDRLQDVYVDRDERTKDRPSDHAPIIITIED